MSTEGSVGFPLLDCPLVLCPEIILLILPLWRQWGLSPFASVSKEGLRVTAITLGEHVYKHISNLFSNFNNSKYSRLPWAKGSPSSEYLVLHTTICMGTVNQVGYPLHDRIIPLYFNGNQLWLQEAGHLFRCVTLSFTGRVFCPSTVFLFCSFFPSKRQE